MSSQNLGLLLSLAMYFLLVPIDLDANLLNASTLIFFLENSQNHSHILTKSVQSGMQHLKNEMTEVKVSDLLRKSLKLGL